MIGGISTITPLSFVNEIVHVVCHTGDITVFHGCTACNPVQVSFAHLTPVNAEDLLLRS